jgi:ATP-dependent 26S proteasome regulatory subunit
MNDRILNYVRSAYPCLYLVSAEEQRVEAELKSVADAMKYTLSYWTPVAGLVNVSTKTIANATDPLDALDAIIEAPEKGIFVLKDFHLYMDASNPNPVLVRKLKDLLTVAKSTFKTIVLLGCRVVLPPELEREITVIEFSLPDREKLGLVLDGILESASISGLEPDQRVKVLESAKGLTTIEAENAMALSIIENKTVRPEIIAREKANAIKKNGILEVVESRVSIDQVGGMHVLKSWLLNRREAFTERAVDYGLPTPKGLLILGIPGTGKSLTAKAVADVFRIPLLRLDAGKLFGSLVGQSEANLRSAIGTAEAISPCVLWIDEFEKAFAGSRSSGSTDGGTSARVFGSFLNWLQEKTSPVFVVATANDISQLPPEMLRKGRFDEIFFVDSPNQAEREQIWKIQILKRGRNPSDYDLTQLAGITDRLTGAEIESVFTEAMFTAFTAHREPTDLDLAGIMTNFTPLAETMAESIKALRAWAKGRARLATTPETQPQGRKLAAL